MTTIRNSPRPIIPPSQKSARAKAPAKAKPARPAQAAAPADASGIPLGPVRIPFQLNVDGKTVQATLVGNVVKDNLIGPGLGKGFSQLRVQVNGESYKLSDTAMDKLLGGNGFSWDAENSCQTQVLEQGLFSAFTGPPKMVTYDGHQFRMVQKSDFDGPPIYYHDADIALVDTSGS